MSNARIGEMATHFGVPILQYASACTYAELHQSTSLVGTMHPYDDGANAILANMHIVNPDLY